jgi:hypothetical protein
MSNVRAFITALKTGETRTTKALEKAVARRRGAAAEEVFAALGERGALKTPLSGPVRTALRRAPLPDHLIERCIDGWPDAQKERARRAIVDALRDGRRVRFRWGLTDARGFESEVRTRGNIVTITALSPRSTLRVSGDDIDVAPAIARGRRRR